RSGPMPKGPPLPHARGAAAPQGDDDIDLLPLGHGPSSIDGFPRDVRRHVGELGNQAATERSPNALRRARRLQAGRANKEDMLSERLRLSPDAVDRPAPEEDAGRSESPAVPGRVGGPPSLREH